MTQPPENFAEPLVSVLFSRPPELDALSEMLHTVRLRADNVIRCAPPPPFRVVIPEGVRALHMPETTGLRLSVGDRDIALGEGDMVLLARGDRHAIAAGEPVEPRGLTDDDLLAGAGNDASASVRWVTGSFAVPMSIPR